MKQPPNLKIHNSNLKKKMLVTLNCEIKRDSYKGGKENSQEEIQDFLHGSIHPHMLLSLSL